MVWAASSGAASERRGAILAGGATSGGTGTQYVSVSSREAPNATENTVQAAQPFAGIARKLHVLLNGNASATQNTVVTLRKNAADTTITVTIVAGATAGTVYSDTSNSVSLAQADKLAYSAVTAGGQSNPAFSATLEVV